MAGLAPIFAIEDGVVINTVDRITKGSPKYAEGGGLIVVIQHDSSPDGSFLVSQYMHMQWTTSKAQRGKKIKRGEIIGFMGSTGESTGSHLHFGIKSTIPGEFSNKSVSPYPMLMSSLSNATDQTEENPPTEEEEEVLSAEEAGVEFAKGYSALTSKEQKALDVFLSLYTEMVLSGWSIYRRNDKTENLFEKKETIELNNILNILDGLEEESDIFGDEVESEALQS